MSLDQRRWLVIVAGVFANLCQGSAYAWTIYAGPVAAQLGCSKTQTALAFSLNIGFLALGATLAGKIADTRGPRLAVVLGGVLFGTGLILAGFVQSLPGLPPLYWLYLTYGVMVSIGSGAAYGAAVGASVKWFPDRRGMASGLVVGALGFGPVIIAPVAQYLIKDTE